MESFFMQLYTNSILAIYSSPHNTREYSSNVLKHILIYLQKIIRKNIKIVDMRINMVQCEYNLSKITVITNVVVYI
ncbi:hypothetical protein BF24_5696 (plasmid) [Bacillus anthracis]|nr:hypothetical protein BACI_pCIXO100250 [Bacillus cereus biovar anthracis str. CI]AJH43161.1 hypothetical protein AW20_5775 [Bacillus anthracis str. Sterne]AJH48912.1 hypothetical protein BG01_5709 [Bacillus anthracis]AJH97096.1 hypothetical protein AK39_5788 [Bacillus anthracis str. V770-NP-1R]AJH85649.1 hypothetical protein BF27_5854 [Bacillus anthracis]